MKKSFGSYVKETSIGRGEAFFKEDEEVIKKFKPTSKPVLEVVQSREEPMQVLVEESKVIEESIETFAEPAYIATNTPLVEETDTVGNFITEDATALNETLSELKNYLMEQQQNQALFGHLITELVSTIQAQNEFIQRKFDYLDESINNTSSILLETTEKLQQLAVRELSIPAPIVNVALSEQKKIVKTVDRNPDGLITKITEEIQQTVSEDK